MKFSYSSANLIFFGFLIILLILPIFDRHKIGKFQTQKSLLGIRLWAITYLPIERARCLPQINAIKFLGNPAGKIFERQNKATLEIKTRHFVTTIEGQKRTILPVNKILMSFSAWNSFHLPRQFVFKQLYALFCAFCWEAFTNNDIFRPVTRILCGGVGGGETSANEAKVDQTTEMYFLLSDPFI